MDELKVFTGNAHPALAQAITEYLEIPLGKCEVFQFSNDNTFVRILENVFQTGLPPIRTTSSKKSFQNYENYNRVKPLHKTL